MKNPHEIPTALATLSSLAAGSAKQVGIESGVRDQVNQQMIDEEMKREKAAWLRYDAYVKHGLVRLGGKRQTHQAVRQRMVKGYLLADLIDVAIENLGPRGTNQITVGRPQASRANPHARCRATNPPPRSGEAELPINASQSEMLRASKKQLADLIRRQQATKKRDRQGWKGAAF